MIRSNLNGLLVTTSHFLRNPNIKIMWETWLVEFSSLFFNIWKNWLHKITPDEASTLMNNLECNLIKISLTEISYKKT